MRPASPAWSARLRRLERRMVRHRRAIVLALVAIAATNLIGRFTPGATVPVIVAAHAVPAGSRLAADDLRTQSWPKRLAGTDWPSKAASLVGRPVSGALAAGEPLTPSRLLARSGAGGPSGSVLVPVRIADAASVALVTAGEVVDVVAAWPAGATAPATASTVAAGARVAAVPAAARPSSSGYDGALLVLEVPPGTATRLAAAAVSARLSLVLRPQ